MAVERVVLLLALASLLAVHAVETKPAGSFVDWLSKQSSTKVHTAQAVEDVEVEKVCVQGTRLGGCSCLQEKNGVCLRSHTEVKLACCTSAGGEKYHTAYEELLAQQHTVGACQFTEDFFPTAIEYSGSETKKLGIFEGTCDLKGEASKCGSPLGDGQTLTITGEILSYNNCAFMGSLADILAEPRCNANRGLAALAKRAKVVRGAGASVAAVNDDTTEPAGAETSFKVGPCSIYVGTFWVASRHQKISYKTGQLQLVVATGEPSQYSTERTPPSKSYVAKDMANALDFFKAETAASS